MTYVPAADRYDRMLYRRCGRSGLQLPAVSLGLWHNFGHDRPLETSRAIVRRAFDLGITHFDLANNYGPPYGSAEENFGRLLASDLGAVPRRARDLDEGRLRHVARPVRRVGLPQVPAREPRPEPRAAWASTTSTSSTRTASTPTTPLEETMGALDAAVRQGKALYVGISSYSAEQDGARRRRSCASSGTPLLIHQPSYSMLNRWIEAGAARHARRARRRLHRLLAARAGHADRQVPRRRSRQGRGRAGRRRSRAELLTERALASGSGR